MIFATKTTKYRSAFHEPSWLLLAAAMAAATGTGPAWAGLTINTANTSEWTASNGIISLGMNTGSGAINQLSVTLNGKTTNIFNTANTPPNDAAPQLYGEYDGPNGILYGSSSASYHLDSNHYLDIWTSTAPSSSSGYFGIQTHWVLTPNSPDIYMYSVFTHAATAPVQTLGQGQFIFKAGDTLFNSLYQANTGPNNLGTFQYTLPSEQAQYNLVTQNPGRQVLPEVIDYTGSGQSTGNPNDPNFLGKYDFATYEQYHTVTGEYSSSSSQPVSAWFVNPSTETLTGGPTKQSIVSGGPVTPQLLDEFISGHYGGPGYTPAAGVNTTRLFGAYELQFATADSATPNINAMYQSALNSVSTADSVFNNEGVLQENGYVPAADRGSVQANVSTGSEGWSGNSNNNVVVLSDPNKDFQTSSTGNQYWGYLNQNGSTTLTGVNPGTYRMTVYQSGQWGEMRVDGVVAQKGQLDTPANLKFTPENFGTSAPIWTIGTPNHSANEFENGHNAAGQSVRAYPGAYNYWQELAANQGKVVYYATAVGGTPATNNLNVWPANQWQTFDPGLYAAPYTSGTDTTKDGYKYIAPSYVNAAGGPATYTGQPWQVHFTTTAAQQEQGQYVVLSIALAAAESDLIVSLNGHQLIMRDPYYIRASDPMMRSGVSGYYGWAALQWNTSDLNAPGQDNIITLSVNHSWGVMYDALRMEITNTSADPNITGWHDYEFLYGNTNIMPNDALGQAAANSYSAQPVPEPATLGLMSLAVGGLLIQARRRPAVPARTARQRH